MVRARWDGLWVQIDQYDYQSLMTSKLPIDPVCRTVPNVLYKRVQQTSCQPSVESRIQGGSWCSGMEMDQLGCTTQIHLEIPQE